MIDNKPNTPFRKKRVKGGVVFEALKFLLIVSILFSFTSCVYEELEPCPPAPRQVNLSIVHDLGWLSDFEFPITRADNSLNKVRYHLKFTRPDENEIIEERTILSDDINRNDFVTELSLMPGDYTLYAWVDFADNDRGSSLYFDSNDFEHIQYVGDYEGDTDMRDVLRGKVSFHIPVAETLDDNEPIDITLKVDRPFARFRFVATDYAEFMESEVEKVMKRFPVMSLEDIYKALSDTYTVRIVYPNYMAHEFNMFKDNPVNSTTGVYFDTKMKAIDESKAHLGMDYVMVNGDESSAQVALEIYDMFGTRVASTGVIDVPTKRNRTTLITGEFLTSSANGGVGINPGFNGDYNIEL